jgi:prefoldin subunit 5
VSPALDSLREAFEQVESAVSEVESESDELRSALDAARTSLQDASTEIRAAHAKVHTMAAAVATALGGPDSSEVGVIDHLTDMGPEAAEALGLARAALDALIPLGGDYSAAVGALEDLDSTADDLESAASDITSALGDGEEQAALQAPLAGTPGEAHEDAIECLCDACVAARTGGGS